MPSNHSKGKHCGILDLGGRRVSHRQLRDIVLTVTVCANLVVFLSAQSQSTAPITTPDTNSTSDSAAPPTTGSISGTVVDKDGAAIPNAKVVLTEGAFSMELASGDDGSFTFRDVPAGAFQLSSSASGFGAQTQSGVLQPGEQHLLSPVQLAVATTVEVNVTQTREEIAEQQIQVQEKQRLLGVVPNYYVSYVPDAVPLNTRQKFQLGWKFVFNPFSLAIAGFTAGIEQANDSYSGYGQGAQGMPSVWAPPMPIWFPELFSAA